MLGKLPFAMQKALIGIGWEPKSVKRLQSGDILIETISASRTKSFLLAKIFIDSPMISPHKSLNTCCGVISKPDLLTVPDAEILEGFLNQGVIEVEAHKLIAPQLPRTYAHAAKSLTLLAIKICSLPRFQHFKMNDPVNTPPNTQKYLFWKRITAFWIIIEDPFFISSDQAVKKKNLHYAIEAISCMWWPFLLTDYVEPKDLLCLLYQSATNPLDCQPRSSSSMMLLHTDLLNTGKPFELYWLDVFRAGVVSAADKRWWVYPLDCCPDAVALYSGCIPGKRCVWFLPDNQHTASLVEIYGGWRHARTKLFFALMDPMLLCQGEPKCNLVTYLLTKSAIQSKSYLSTKKFLYSTLTVTPHRSLNFSRGVISEPDLLTSPEAEILDEISDQGVINLNLPATIKAGYLNCKICPYIPNPLHCVKCQRFGHSQTSCHYQLTCSRCATVGHPSTNCTPEPKCVNYSQSHPSDSKLCSKWKTEKEIQSIKTKRNIMYVEARKLIVPQLCQTYAQAAKPSTVTTTTQTDENITKIVCVHACRKNRASDGATVSVYPVTMCLSE
ncbi:uncharacterized protein TNCV_4453231 [Trichonephila clavipes]|nr:uncharacterized protein TNCV_4453231 [Trichonephila clavipes]